MGARSRAVWSGCKVQSCVEWVQGPELCGVGARSIASRAVWSGYKVQSRVSGCKVHSCVEWVQGPEPCEWVQGP